MTRALVGSMLGIYRFLNSPLQDLAVGTWNRVPQYLDDYCLRGPRWAPYNYLPTPYVCKHPKFARK